MMIEDIDILQSHSFQTLIDVYKRQSLMRYTNVFHHLIKNSPFAKKRIRELTEDDIYTFIQTILMDKDLSTKEYGNVKTVLQGMIRYARFEKKYTSINLSLIHIFTEVTAFI